MAFPYEQAFNRIRAEYLEMPGMRLTHEQVQRLSGVDHSICGRVLDDLVRAKFLRIREDGSYARWTDQGLARPRVVTEFIPTADAGRARSRHA